MELSKVRGILGEQLAADYYLNQNLTILEKNYCCRYGEIDIIAKKKNTFIFCEVKTRSTHCIADPKESVTLKKQQRIIKTALTYLQQHNISDPFMRFDVIEIILDQNQKMIQMNCIEQAF